MKATTTAAATVTVNAYTITPDEIRSIYDNIAQPEVAACLDPNDAKSVNERETAHKLKHLATCRAQALWAWYNRYSSESRKESDPRLGNNLWNHLVEGRAKLLARLTDATVSNLKAAERAIRYTLNQAFDLWLCTTCYNCQTEDGSNTVEITPQYLLSLDHTVNNHEIYNYKCAACGNESLRKPGMSRAGGELHPEMLSILLETVPFYRPWEDVPFLRMLTTRAHNWRSRIRSYQDATEVFEHFGIVEEVETPNLDKPTVCKVKVMDPNFGEQWVAPPEEQPPTVRYYPKAPSEPTAETETVTETAT